MGQELDQLLSQRKLLTGQLYAKPYSANLYCLRAKCHQNLQYPDLACGDAYKALSLTDEVLDDCAEFHEVATECTDLEHSGLSDIEGSGTVKSSIDALVFAIYQVLITSLVQCGCHKSAYEYLSRLSSKFGPGDTLSRLRSLLRSQLSPSLRSRTEPDEWLNQDQISELSDDCSVRREMYPWNQFEPNRTSPEAIDFLNSKICAAASRCIIKATTLPVLGKDGQDVGVSCTQLGLFARQNLEAGDLIMQERSLLTVNNRVQDALCDACSSTLESDSKDSHVICPECQVTTFCSEECLQLASRLYHPALCDRDVETFGKSSDRFESVQSLYFQLLVRAIALAETQGLHPLELSEVRYIWGDFVTPRSDEGSTTAPSLPFSFKYHVVYPLLLLEKMDIDIYERIKDYDVWIFNTLYAKFRGTASARMGPDGKPEVAGVHPLWCLANHSCAPNVRWEWAGNMKFWVRDQKWGPERDGRQEGRIKAGEEILNHYCDIDLDVEERRQWAAGALGGTCMCERCVYESSRDNMV